MTVAVVLLSLVAVALVVALVLALLEVRFMGPRLERIEHLLSSDLADLHTVQADHEDRLQELETWRSTYPHQGGPPWTPTT